MGRKLSDIIYPILPIFLQNTGFSIYGQIWQHRRFGGIFDEELRKCVGRELYTAAQWEAYQTVQLRNLLLHAFETVPFYKDKYKKHGITSAVLSSFELEDLSKLPYLTKEELRKYGKSTLLSRKREPGGQFFSSSGSTGTPTAILYSRPFHQRWSAVFEARIRYWAGVNRHIARGMIGGRLIVPPSQKTPPFYRINKAEQQIYFSINHLKKETAYDYIEAIQKYDLEYMTGYAASNYLLAKYSLDLGIKNKELKAVITSSELLTTKMRSVFHKAYQCDTYDSWSGIEACGLISECEYHSLHISPDVGIIELATVGESIKGNDLKEVICTGLLNYDQPLIRYKIGDLVSVSNVLACKCGRNMPAIDSIIGRIDDIVTLPDGRQFSSFNRFFAEIKGIAEAQVIQKKLDYFVINIVPSDDYSQQTKKEIEALFFNRIGLVALKINELDYIPRNFNGKFKAVISEVPLQ